MLGRDPSDQETRDFTYRMGKLAAANPMISKTVTPYMDGAAVSSDPTTTPGFTAGDMKHQVYDEAQSDPDYAEYALRRTTSTAWPQPSGRSPADVC